MEGAGTVVRNPEAEAAMAEVARLQAELDRAHALAAQINARVGGKPRSFFDKLLGEFVEVTPLGELLHRMRHLHL